MIRDAGTWNLCGSAQNEHRSPTGEAPHSMALNVALIVIFAGLALAPFHHG
jgi:hypothetical protein